MKKILLFLVVVSNVYAQGNDSLGYYQTIKIEEEAKGLAELSKLQKYGEEKDPALPNFPVWRYPICSEVVDVYTRIKDRIYQNVKNQNCDTPEAVAAISGKNYKLENSKVVFDQLAYASQLKQHSDHEGREIAVCKVNKEINTVTTSVPQKKSSDGRSFYGCFSEDTKLTVFDLASGIYNSSMRFGDFADYWDDYRNNPDRKIYVLSSPTEMIPDAPKEFLSPCWGEVNFYTHTELYDGEALCTLTYGGKGAGSQCTATPNHRFRVQITGSNGQVTYDWKALKDIDPKTMKLVSNLENIFTEVQNVGTGEVPQEWWDWLSSDMTVYNLSVNTGTYFVSDKGNDRVLVHNVKF